ncbi:hypothetical protein I3F58_01445 [Streptomyces sp. MUM 203J]|uniref:hypothetical protein n=1 Tax=Streptomyces sp. MUM 203J TaxID=2791990 RepID=UPI001F04337A|nr:hypothetical protein [Streptomyces sp. MUM 203J]MCH0538245.1 hypothetical protein [Streptomyces sp. MUM 203J]
MTHPDIPDSTPLPDFGDLVRAGGATPTGHPVLDAVLTDVRTRDPATTVAYYDDAP